MDVLLTQQNISVRTVLRALENFKKIGQGNYTYAKVRNRLQNLKEFWIECKQQHVQLIQITDEETRATMKYFTENQFIAAEESYYNASDFMMEWIVKLESAPSTSARNQHSTSRGAFSWFVIRSSSYRITDFRRWLSQLGIVSRPIHFSCQKQHSVIGGSENVLFTILFKRCRA